MTDIVKRLRARRMLATAGQLMVGKTHATNAWITDLPDPDCQEAADIIEDTQMTELLVRYDRAMALGRLAQPYILGDEAILKMVNDAGRAGVILFWLKTAIYTQLTNRHVSADFFHAFPWCHEKHGNWKEKYHMGCDYDFALDAWVPAIVRAAAQMGRAMP